VLHGSYIINKQAQTKQELKRDTQCTVAAARAYPTPTTGGGGPRIVMFSLQRRISENKNGS
jgi:hypothetical protein